jgi:hypothetical protein
MASGRRDVSQRCPDCVRHCLDRIPRDALGSLLRSLAPPGAILANLPPATRGLRLNLWHLARFPSRPLGSTVRSHPFGIPSPAPSGTVAESVSALRRGRFPIRGSGTPHWRGVPFGTMSISMWSGADTLRMLAACRLSRAYRNAVRHSVPYRAPHVRLPLAACPCVLRNPPACSCIGVAAGTCRSSLLPVTLRYRIRPACVGRATRCAPAGLSFLPAAFLPTPPHKPFYECGHFPKPPICTDLQRSICHAQNANAPGCPHRPRSN